MLPMKFYDDMFDSLLDDSDLRNDMRMMKSDIYEKDNNYVVEMDLPGFKKEDIKIECNRGNLIVTAEKKHEDEDKNKKYLRRERSYGKYSRSFYLGDIDEERINAEFHHGTLRITIPKKDEHKNTKYIDIK